MSIYDQKSLTDVQVMINQFFSLSGKIVMNQSDQEGVESRHQTVVVQQKDRGYDREQRGLIKFHNSPRDSSQFYFHDK